MLLNSKTNPNIHIKSQQIIGLTLPNCNFQSKLFTTTKVDSEMELVANFRQHTVPQRGLLTKNCNSNAQTTQ